MTAKGDLYMADTNGFHRGKLITGYNSLNVHYISKNPMAKNHT